MIPTVLFGRATNGATMAARMTLVLTMVLRVFAVAFETWEDALFVVLVTSVLDVMVLSASVSWTECVLDQERIAVRKHSFLGLMVYRRAPSRPGRLIVRSRGRLELRDDLDAVLLVATYTDPRVLASDLTDFRAVLPNVPVEQDQTTSSL